MTDTTHSNQEQVSTNQAVLKRCMERFQISEEEARWLAGMLACQESKGIHPSTFVSVLRSLGLEKIKSIDKNQFIDLVWKRNESSSLKNIAKQQRLREKKKREDLLKKVKERQDKEWKILALDAPLKRKGVTSFSPVHVRSRAELEKEFNRYLINSVRCDLLLEVLNGNIDTMQRFLVRQYPQLESHIARLIQEVGASNADSQNANEIKQEIRPLIQGESATISFFKQVRILLSQIEEKNTTYRKAVDSEEGYDKIAYNLGIENSTICARYKAMFQRLKPDYERRKVRIGALEK